MTRWLILSLMLLTAACGLRPSHPGASVEHTGAAPGPGQGGGADGM